MHLVNHAFFKALLFLAAGAVIHSMRDEQDVRRLGGLVKFLPFIYSVFIVGSLSLMALPFLTGFYSKDLIIELAYASGLTNVFEVESTGSINKAGIFAYIFLTITAGITAFYSFRLIALVFMTTPNAPKMSYLSTHEANNTVIVPLFILSIFSILFGYIFSDLFVGMGSDSFILSTFTHPNHIGHIEAEFSLPILIKLLPAILSISGAALALILYHNTPQFLTNTLIKPGAEFLKSRENLNPVSSLPSPLLSTSVGRGEKDKGGMWRGSLISIISLYSFFNGKYYFDIIYNHYLIRSSLNLGFILSNNIDRGFIELSGPFGLSNILYKSGKNIAKLDTGVITSYALYIVLALLTLIFLLFVPTINITI
jgi:NADH-ubiquinone oxidoreductase chain 5